MTSRRIARGRFASAAIALRVPVLAVRLCCYFVIGATIQGLVILMHEPVHGILFRNRHLNRWVGFACGLPAFLSVSAYRIGHLPHHRYERSRRDPDELENFSRKRGGRLDEGLTGWAKT